MFLQNFEKDLSVLMVFFLPENCMFLQNFKKFPGKFAICFYGILWYVFFLMCSSAFCLSLEDKCSCTIFGSLENYLMCVLMNELCFDSWKIHMSSYYIQKSPGKFDVF